MKTFLIYTGLFGLYTFFVLAYTANTGKVAATVAMFTILLIWFIGVAYVANKIRQFEGDE